MLDVSPRICSKLATLSDTALLAEVARVGRAHRAVTAELVAHLAEMDARKLYLSEATPSMFAYCVERLGFSEDEACRRIDAARAARKWPVFFERIASGELSLSVIGKLKALLTDENVDELVAAVSGKSARDAERILAARFPKPDTADSIRKLPNRSDSSGSVAESPAPAAVKHSKPAGLAADTEGGTAAAPAPTAASVSPAPIVDRGRLQPLSAERVQVKFTASRALEEKLALARDLMSHRNPRGDLATIVEAGLDLLIAELSKQKLGQTTRPRKKRRLAKRTHVASATKRDVVARDGLSCSFVNERGERCGARAFLEFDHRNAKGRGFGSEPGNVRLLCRAHNQAEAERVYGKEHMERSRGRNKPTLVREQVRTGEFVIGFVPRIRPASRNRSPATSRVEGTFELAKYHANRARLRAKGGRSAVDQKCIAGVVRRERRVGRGLRVTRICHHNVGTFSPVAEGVCASRGFVTTT